MKRLTCFFGGSVLIVLCLALELFLPGRAVAITWKIAYTPLPNTPYNIFITEVFKSGIEKCTNGKVQIELLPGVVGVMDILDAVKAGRVDGGFILSTGYYGGIVPKWDLTGIPGLILMEKEDEAMPRIINEFLFGAIDEEARRDWNSMVVSISWWSRSTFFSNKVVNKIEDFKGLKCRAHTVWNARLIELLGGATVSMPFGELQTSLQRQIVDACTSAIPPVMASGVYEQLKYIDPWPFGASLEIGLIGTKCIKNLPEPLREAVLNEFKKLNIQAQQLEINMVKGFVKSAEEKGLKTTKIADEEMIKFTNLSKERIYPQWLDKAGSDGQKWMDRVTELYNK